MIDYEFKIAKVLNEYFAYIVKKVSNIYLRTRYSFLRK